MNVNKATLIGRMGDDIKMHYFDTGGCVGRFPLATTEKYTNRNGEKVESTDWHNIKSLNKAAELIEKYTKKGDLIYIEGKIKNRKYTDDNGHERYVTEIQMLSFTFLPNNKADSGSAVDKYNSTQNSSDYEHDDLPF